MNTTITVALLIALLAIAGCRGGSQTCHEPQRYQSEELGERVVAPEDLDQLQSGKELKIPEASPREPRPEGADCLELPPRIGT